MAAAESNVGGSVRTPVHLWIVGVLAFLWNLMGAFDYVASQFNLEFYMAQFPPEMLEWIDAMPAWATAAWAFGVWGAFVGTIGLLMRKKWAVIAYGVSLAGLAVSSIYSYILTDAMEMAGGGAVVMNILIWVVAIFLLFYALAMSKKGVLG
jgi:hypothetical protein